MYSWNVREISLTEYHVIETRFVGEPEFIVFRWNRSRASSKIANAMRIAQSIRDGRDSIHNSLLGIESALQRFKSDVTAAEKYCSNECSSNKNTIILDLIKKQPISSYNIIKHLIKSNIFPNTKGAKSNIYARLSILKKHNLNTTAATHSTQKSKHEKQHKTNPNTKNEF
jgi:hypothetical protein